MKKFIINVIMFIPKVIIGIIGLLLTLILLGYVQSKIILRKVFGFLTCDGN